MILGGLYVIYTNKNNNGSAHFTSNHGKAGLALIICSIGAGMAGGVRTYDTTMEYIFESIHSTLTRCFMFRSFCIPILDLTRPTSKFDLSTKRLVVW